MNLRDLTQQQVQYIRNIEGIKTLQIPGKDFIGSEGMKNKQAIQYLYIVHYFPEVRPTDLLNRVEMGQLNTAISKLKRSRNFNLLFNYKPNGIGPGEVMMYFLLNDGVLGGVRQRGDLQVGSSLYEVKVPDILANKSAAYDVRLAGSSGTQGMQEVLQELLTLRKSLNLINLESKQINIMRTQSKDKFDLIENKFGVEVENYFKNKKVIILNGSASNRGVVEAVKEVKAADVQLYRFTGNEFKATIKL